MFEKCFIIAEVGINHNGNIDIAKKLIDVASFAGCDAVKFQKRTIEVVYSQEELDKPRESMFGETNGALKRGLEFGLDEYAEIDRYCRDKKIEWFASCWDEGSVDFIEQFGPRFHKIASASITDKDLIEYIRNTGKYIIMSTGMCDMVMIEDAVNNLGEDNLAILHCTSTYPSKNNEINLMAIPVLQKVFPGIPIGYSGHEKGILIPAVAVALGAKIVERHITLDRTMWGSDQAASLEPQGVIKLVRDIRNVEEAMGNGIIKIYDSELPIIEKLRRIK